MVGKISSGGFAGGIFNYLEREKSEIVSTNMLGETKQELTRDFLECAELNPRVEKPVKHHVISFSPEDMKKLSPELLEDLIKDYLEDTGYSNNQYAAFIHKDSNVDHLHLVINKVDFDGLNTHPKFEKKQARKTLMKLEEKYNLTRTPAKSLDKSKHYEIGKKNFKGKDKEGIKSVINETLHRLKVKTDKEFVKHIKSAGIGIKINSAGNGINFELNGKSYKASSIDRKLSFGKILNTIAENKKEFDLKELKKIEPKIEPKRNHKPRMRM